MLVLTRKKNESVVIADSITVTVVEIREDKVRLGIVAPKEVPVHRLEVFEAIHGSTGPPFREKPLEVELNALDPPAREYLERLSLRLIMNGVTTSRGALVSSMLAAIRESAIDLTAATSLNEVKESLLQRLKG